MKSIALTTLILISVGVRSQSISSSVINSSGNSFSQGYYSIDWSVGELALVSSMHSAGDIVIITNGFLQPNQSHHDSNARQRFTDSEIKIMPNPTYGKIEVNVSTAQKGTLHFHVYDANGKLLRTEKLLSNGIMLSKFIELSSYTPGTYFLRIDLNPYPGSISKTGSYKILKL